MVSWDQISGKRPLLVLPPSHFRTKLDQRHSLEKTFLRGVPYIVKIKSDISIIDISTLLKNIDFLNVIMEI